MERFAKEFWKRLATKDNLMWTGGVFAAMCLFDLVMFKHISLIGNVFWTAFWSVAWNLWHMSKK